jgi:hypothetical protein
MQPLTSLGQRDAAVVVDDVAARQGAAPSGAPRPSGSGRAPAAGGDRRQGAAAAPRLPPVFPRWAWLAIGLPVSVAALLLVVLVRRPAATRASNATPSATVFVSLDSIPQGATVTVAAQEGTEPRSLGETPMLVKLSRSERPAELVLTKAGFAPLTFKVIANQDKHTVAMLEAVPPPPLVTSTAPEDEAPKGTSSRSRRAAKQAARKRR